MIIVQLSGGLGNQLFQYATAKALSLKNNTDLHLDISSFYREEIHELEVPRDFELVNFEGVNEPLIKHDPFDSIEQYPFLKKKFFNKLTIPHKRNIYKDLHFKFDKNLFNLNSNVFIKGGWQSEKYFSAYKTELRKVLILKENLYSNVSEFGSNLCKENSVSVHIRRGDFLRKKIILEWHGVLTTDYYKQALNMLKEKHGSLNIYYFSDDPEWVKNYLLPLFPGQIVSGNISQTHYEDLYLMSQCKHNIIANSSFSWWAAWINSNQNKTVIAPLKWFDKANLDTKDLIPDDWIRI